MTRRVALVTGGAKRVGRAITLALARAGCDVHLTYHGSETDAEATVRDARSLGVSARAWRVPMHESDQLGARCEDIRTASARWDVVVINASRYVPSPLETLTHERLVEDFVVNAASAAIVCGVFTPALRASRGAIVTMCDLHATGEVSLARRDHLSYAMSKAALLEMTMSLARDLAPEVRVNAVAPGVVAWPESGREADAAMQTKYLSRVPLGRAGTPEEAAEAVRWLAFDATYCTGVVLRVDGGRPLG